MSKNILFFGLGALLVVGLLFGSVAWVYAQAPTPTTPPSTDSTTPIAPGWGMMGGRGWGMMGGRGMMGAWGGYLQDEMLTALANKLGMSVDDLKAKIQAGTTPAQIAQEKGLTAAEFRTLMQEARNEALDLAVQNGKLTAEQAAQMKQGTWALGSYLKDTFFATLAEKLGLTTDQLQAKIDEARSAALDRAVQEGKLTSQQSEWLKQNAPQGGLGGFGWGCHGGPRGGRGWGW
jgi:polyhydroxyalkanoate synthesis regulator phasin